MNSTKGPMKRSNDPSLLLLEQRNYPTAGMPTSPAQRLRGRPESSITPRVKSTATGQQLRTIKLNNKPVLIRATISQPIIYQPNAYQ